MFKNNNFICFIFVAFTNLAFSQIALLKGQISSTSENLEEIVVYNLTQNKVVLTKNDGSFEIEAVEGDLLTFQAVHLDFWRQSVKKSDIENGMNVKMTEKTNTLDEIEIVDYPKINAKDLGIINYTPKKYTPAERRLRPTIYTKKDFIDFLTLQSNTIPLDPIIYWLTGQTKKLKTNLKIEQKQLLIEDLLIIFNEQYFIDELKIDKDFISAFIFFVVEDIDFVRVYQSKDITLIKWQLTELSTQFKKLLENE